MFVDSCCLLDSIELTWWKFLGSLWHCWWLFSPIPLLCFCWDQWHAYGYPTVLLFFIYFIVNCRRWTFCSFSILSSYPISLCRSLSLKVVTKTLAINKYTLSFWSFKTTFNRSWLVAFHFYVWLADYLLIFSQIFK